MFYEGESRDEGAWLLLYLRRTHTNINTRVDRPAITAPHINYSSISALAELTTAIIQPNSSLGQGRCMLLHFDRFPLIFPVYHNQLLPRCAVTTFGSSLPTCSLRCGV